MFFKRKASTSKRKTVERPWGSYTVLEEGKGYKIKQFFDEYGALDFANELGGEIHEVDFLRIKKDLKFNFKHMITDLDDDSKTFLIKILTCKMGVVALEKGLDLDSEVSYLVVYR